MWCVLLADRRRLAVQACRSHERIPATIDTELNCDWWIDGDHADFMHLAFVFSHLSVLRKKHSFPFLPSEQRDAPPINFTILIFLSAPQQYKYIISHVSPLFKIYRVQWRDQGSNIFSMSKTHITSRREAETAVFRVMDYDQFDEDVCQHNTISDGAANWMEPASGVI